jgi:hypothetical protein
VNERHSAALAGQNGVVTSDGAIRNLDSFYTGQDDINELKYWSDYIVSPPIIEYASCEHNILFKV